MTIHGLAGQVADFTAADLAKLPQVHVSVTHGGKTTDYAGPELAGLLRQVDAPLGARMHGSAVATVVLVRASDGYRVALYRSARRTQSFAPAPRSSSPTRRTAMPCRRTKRRSGW